MVLYFLYVCIIALHQKCKWEDQWWESEGHEHASMKPDSDYHDDNDDDDSGDQDEDEDDEDLKQYVLS